MYALCKYTIMAITKTHFKVEFGINDTILSQRVYKINRSFRQTKILILVRRNLHSVSST